MTIFVTGKSGVGKSYLADRLAAQLKYKYVDIDAISKSIYLDSEIVDAVVELLGGSILDADGHIDTKCIGKIIFNKNNVELKEKFYELTYRYIQQLLKSVSTENMVMEWSMLPLVDLWRMPGVKVLVTADEQTRVQKILTRDNISLSYLQTRDAAGVNFDQYQYDYVFNNDYTEESVVSFVNEIKKIIK